MEYKLKRLGRELAAPGKALEFYRDDMQLPDGKVEKWDFVHHKKGGGACVVPILPDGRILLIHQYRPAVNRETTELPAGAFDAEDPDFAITASRELEEETGYSSDEWTHLITVPSAATMADNYAYIYRAKNCRRTHEQHTDSTEFLRVEKYSADEIEELIATGRFQQAMHIMAWLLAQR